MGICLLLHWITGLLRIKCEKASWFVLGVPEVGRPLQAKTGMSGMTQISVFVLVTRSRAGGRSSTRRRWPG